MSYTADALGHATWANDSAVTLTELSASVYLEQTNPLGEALDCSPNQSWTATDVLDVWSTALQQTSAYEMATQASDRDPTTFSSSHLTSSPALQAGTSSEEDNASGTINPSALKWPGATAGRKRRKPRHSTQGEFTVQDDETRSEKRKIQLRDAQRAFRQRKETLVQTLEVQLRQCEAARENVDKENARLKIMLRLAKEANTNLWQSLMTFVDGGNRTGSGEMLETSDPAILQSLDPGRQFLPGLINQPRETSNQIDAGEVSRDWGPKNWEDLMGKGL